MKIQNNFEPRRLISLEVNDNWYIKLPDASVVTEAKIIDITNHTVLLRLSTQSQFEKPSRYLINEINWVEIFNNE